MNPPNSNFKTRFDYLESMLGDIFRENDGAIWRVSTASLTAELERTGKDQVILEALSERPQLLHGVEPSLDPPLNEEGEEEEVEIKDYSVITAYVGDDGASVSDNVLFMPTMIAVGQSILKIKISEPDIGNSKAVVNYAETWLLLPPGARAQFDTLVDQVGMRGIPTTLDSPDLKQLCPIRKMTDEEPEFSGKYKYLARYSEWVDDDWPTKSLHELAKVLALSSLDFKGSRSFPYLYKAEGGCGGKPPWNQILTVEFALFHFERGKAKAGIITAVQESNLIRKGLMKPSDGLFLKLVHHSADITAWSAIAKMFIDSRKEGLPDSVIKDQVDVLLEREVIPQQLMDSSVVVYPRDIATGMLIARLRQYGLLLTELDVRMLMTKEGLTSALTGELPLGPLLKRQEEDIDNVKKKGFGLIVKIAESYCSGVEQSFQNAKSAVESRTISLFTEYYETHPGDSMTSLGYSDELRLFKSTDVENYFSTEERKRFFKSLGINQYYGGQVPDTFVFTPTTTNTKLDHESAVIFAKDFNLGQLSEKRQFLPQIGSGDPIVLQQCIAKFSERTENQVPMEGYVQIVVTDDRNLASIARAYMLRTYGVKVIKVSPVDFFLWVEGKTFNDGTPAQIAAIRPEIILGRRKALGWADIKRIALISGVAEPTSVDFIIDKSNFRRKLAASRMRSLGGLFETVRGGFLPRAQARKPRFSLRSRSSLIPDCVGGRISTRTKGQQILETYAAEVY